MIFLKLAFRFLPNATLKIGISIRDFDRIPRWNLDGARFKSVTNIPQDLGHAPEPSGNAGSAAFLIPAL